MAEYCPHCDWDEFYRQDRLRKYVDQRVEAKVNNELFWNNVFNNIRFSAKVHKILQQRIPQQVDTFLSNRLPQVLPQYIQNSLPGILDNSMAMNQILVDHSNRLQHNLEQTARQHLQKIVDEDKYHLVNQQYFAAISQRADQAIARFNKDGQSAITSIQQDYHETEEKLQSKIEKIDNLEQKVTNLKTGVAVGFGLNVCAIGGLVYWLTKQQS